MSSLGDMKTRIQGELQRGSRLESEIESAIISALRFYKRYKFRFNISRTTTTLSPDIEYIDLPTDFIEADTMVLQKDSELDPMQERSHYWIDNEKRWTNHRSRPYVFSVQADELRLYPTPDSTSYSLIMTYHYELPEPTSDGASTAWFTDGEELIRTHAKVDLLENVIRGPESMEEAGRLRLRETEVLKQLRVEYKRSQSSGRITPQ